MKKLFLIIAVFAGAVFFSSCGDDPLQDMFELVSGNGTVIVNNGSEQDLTTSIVMFDKEAPETCAIGLAMNMDVNDLINAGSSSDLDYPFLCYRVIGNDVKSGSTLTVNNVLTEEDLQDFDYRSLLNGKFANNQVVGYAISDHEFYVMSTGSIHLTKVSKTKVVGSYDGMAYFIDTENPNMLSEVLVPIQGTFKSRVIKMMGWLQRLQNEAAEE